MSNLKKIATAQLCGAALDWAVAQAEDWDVTMIPISQYSNASTGHKVKATGYWIAIVGEAGEREVCSPSTDWSQGGPLIDLRITAMNDTGDVCWCHSGDRLGEGQTILIAACRAIVATTFGDFVMIPIELVTA